MSSIGIASHSLFLRQGYSSYITSPLLQFAITICLSLALHPLLVRFLHPEPAGICRSTIFRHRVFLYILFIKSETITAPFHQTALNRLRMR
jgi:hypothetical protein